MEVQKFLEKVFADLKAQSIDVGRFQMDHACFRVQTQKEYQDYKNQFLKIADLLIESPVNGRMISTLELKEPIYFEGRVLRVIELPSPKEGSSYATGFEHVEFVVDQSFEGIQSQYPNQNWEISNKVFNAEMSLKLPSCSIKFHHLPLKAVVELEKNKMLFPEVHALLKAMSKYTPLVSGSIPLNIQNEKSDIDIIFSSQDLNQFAKDLAQYANQYSPEITIKNLRGHESAIVRYITEHGKYECVAQKRPVYEIIANQHFLIESRLLNIAGEEARSAIYKLKKAGIPTEPAFAQYFQISGEPYETLLQMNLLSESQLNELYGK